MKKIVLLTLFSALSTAFFAQITVADYSRKVTANVSHLETIPIVQAQSDCGDVVVKSKDVMMSGGCLGTLVRSYTFTDGCGNTASAEQYVHLVDDEAPILKNVPKDITVASDKIPKAAAVTATDNVGDDDVKVEMTETVDEETHQVVREWRATDKCGNSSVARQVITITGL